MSNRNPWDIPLHEPQTPGLRPEYPIERGLRTDPDAWVNFVSANPVRFFCEEPEPVVIIRTAPRRRSRLALFLSGLYYDIKWRCCA